ncbi:MAG: M14 family zinc carboxypeptidase [Bacteroidia bacterium]
MRHYLSSIVLILLLFSCKEIEKKIEESTTEPPTMAIDVYKENQSLDYDNLIKHYELLDKKYKEAKLINYGNGDLGKPIYAFIIDKSERFSQTKDQVTILINNAIHPGEPCGVDASINLANQLLGDKNYEKILENVTVVIIPIYNVDGALNRGCCSRVNQNGPEMYGFRGNAKNLDLNRDFVKNDSKNSEVFAKIFHDFKPQLFVDTHESNGSDYQYTMTLITSQLDKMHPELSSYVREKLRPFLFAEMEKANYPMVPYVVSKDDHPESGIVDYLETPRYSTGYANLFNCISFVTETHMWKPYPNRVESTYIFLEKLIKFAANNHTDIIEKVTNANKQTIEQKYFTLNWQLDTTRFDTINFKGYEAIYYNSSISGLKTYKYDRNKPFEKPIHYYNRYNALDTIQKPKYYVIPQAWDDVIGRLENNRIEFSKLEKDTTIEVETYYIERFETWKNPYEGHYGHYNTNVRKETQKIQFYEGDILISTNQQGVRFLIETLEPKASDSYFNWGFFDAIVQQKEYFSAYIFEDKAIEILETDSTLKADFYAKQKADKEFASNHYKQLDFIYKRSPHYEKSHNRYPVYRIIH